MQRINITPEEQGTVNDDDDETVDLDNPVEVRDEWERQRRENQRAYQRRGTTVV